MPEGPSAGTHEPVPENWMLALVCVVREAGPVKITVSGQSWKSPLRPPIVSVTATSVLGVVADTPRTHTVCASLIVPGVDVKLPSQPIEYSPLSTLTGEATSRPVMRAAPEAMVTAGS